MEPRTQPGEDSAPPPIAEVEEDLFPVTKKKAKKGKKGRSKSEQFEPLEDTVQSFKDIVAGKYDDLPESAFYMVGGIDEAIAKAKKLAAEAA